MLKHHLNHCYKSEALHTNLDQTGQTSYFLPGSIIHIGECRPMRNFYDTMHCKISNTDQGQGMLKRVTSCGHRLDT